MAYINFPIKLLKKIEPLLEEYFSYERSRKKLISLFHPLSKAILRPL